ncbi:hypothetical protein I4U23_011441 [Adineta vaga]|nr:hypothetical protein I4U23_011441 [Adineta vaga]
MPLFYDEKERRWIWKFLKKTLTCPCRTITVPYQTFINITPVIHSVYRPSYIPNINPSAYSSTGKGVNKRMDIFTVLPSQFRALQNLCIRAVQTIESTLNIFGRQSLISNTTLTNELINMYTNDAVIRMKTKAIGDFISIFDMINGMTHGDHIISALQTNFQIISPSIVPDETNLLQTLSSRAVLSTNIKLPGIESIGPTCSCEITMDCLSYMVIADQDIYYSFTEEYFIIPGFYTGCYPVRALLYSSLTCFFDINCLDIITSIFNSYESLPSSIKILNTSDLIISTENTSINTLVNRIFVENWITILNYSNYYKICSPIYCTYSYIGHRSFLDIVSIILSSISSLTIILKFIIFQIVKYFVKRRLLKNSMIYSTPINQTLMRKVIHFIQKPWKSILMKIRTVNILPPSYDISDQKEIEHALKNGFIATKLYFIFFILTIIILAFILRLMTNINVITINNPNRTVYENLLIEQGSTNLQCPCSNIAISYNRFIELEPSFHSICTSNFTDQVQLAFLSLYMPSKLFNNSNFLMIFSRQMIIIEQLCTLANKTITNGIINFYINSFVSTELLPHYLLEFQIKSLKETFINNLIADFILTIDMINIIFQNNQLISADFTNWQLFMNPSLNNIITSEPIIYANCSCAHQYDSLCQSVATFNPENYFNETANFVSDVIVGCYVSSSFKQTNTIFFYNQTALDIPLIDVYYDDITWGFEIPIINSLETSELDSINQTNVKLDDLLNKLFIKKWYLQINYDNYFIHCAPISCSYQLIERQNYLYITIFLFGIVFSLSTILRLISLAIVAFLRRKSNLQSQS